MGKRLASGNIEAKTVNFPHLEVSILCRECNVTTCTICSNKLCINCGKTFSKKEITVSTDHFLDIYNNANSKSICYERDLKTLMTNESIANDPSIKSRLLGENCVVFDYWFRGVSYKDLPFAKRRMLKRVIENEQLPQWHEQIADDLQYIDDYLINFSPEHSASSSIN